MKDELKYRKDLHLLREDDLGSRCSYMFNAIVTHINVWVFPPFTYSHGETVQKELTSNAHQSCIIEITSVNFICNVNAASHSGSISMCCPT